ncbi:sulfotransferase [bacterium]|nr:sulfotransferase [bacterium]
MQKILSCHSEIHTASEPWIMLHPIYALRDTGYSAEYNEHFASKALGLFLRNLPNHEETYVEGLRLMFSHIYGMALKESNKRYFLDKTPRYYEIIPELARVFPEAKFVILLRNPLATLNSRVHLLSGKDLKSLSLYKRDLLNGPNKLLEGIKLLGNNCEVVKYENLVEEPQNALKNLCSYLDITYSSTLVNYNSGSTEKWEYGDPHNVYQNSKPNSSYQDKWRESLQQPQLWRIYSEYAKFLGDSLFDRLGYDFSLVTSIIDEMRPNSLKLLRTKSLKHFLS